MRRCRFPELTIILALVSSSAAAADPKPLEPKARVLVDRGLEAYRDGRYEEAIRELSAAYEIDPRREILFNWAQAERLSGDCDAAIPLYQEFLDSDPPSAQAKQARRLIEKCDVFKPKGDRPAAGPPPGGLVDIEPGPDPEPERDRRERAPAAPSTREDGPVWYRDAWGGALVGVGLVGVGLGATFLVLSERSFDDAGAARTYPDYDARFDEAVSSRRIGVVGLTLGAALVAAGVGRWIYVSYQDGGGAVVVGGAF